MLPCAVGLLLPGIAVLLLAGRHTLLATSGYTVAAGLVAWDRAVGSEITASSQLLALLTLGGVAFFLLARESWPAALGGALVVGVVAGSTWVPCVGEQLARILTDAPANPTGAIIPMLVYATGVCAVLIAVSIVPLAFPTTRRWFEARVTTAVGGLIAMVLVAALAGDLYRAILSEFAEIGAR